jgi:antitoxin component of MazEF toxin-antitoxin module
MKLNITTWGDSLGLQLPKTITDLMGVGRGSQVEASVIEGKLVLSPVQEEPSLETLAAAIDLEAMVKQVTRKNRHDRGEFDDEPQGDEVW